MVSAMTDERYHWGCGPAWRDGWFRPNSWSAHGITCQCEERPDRSWDRSACDVHGPYGKRYYAEIEPQNSQITGRYRTSDNTLRKIEVYREGTWIPIRLAEVKKGETFRCLDYGREKVYTAASDGYWTDLNGRRSILSIMERKNAVVLIED
jgi:hypothetical protein